MMTSLETLKISFALYIKLFGESVSMDIGTEGTARVKDCVDIAALCRAKEKIQQIVERERFLTGNRRRMTENIPIKSLEISNSCAPY